MTLPFEVILQVGAEGGSITLRRWEISPDDWMWSVETNEVMLYDLLDGEEGFAPRDAVKSGQAISFEDSLLLMDKYQWTKLTPMRVHPDYRVAILEAVRDRGGLAAERRWKAMTRSGRVRRFMIE